jgi:hypothetical protein
LPDPFAAADDGVGWADLGSLGLRHWLRTEPPDLASRAGTQIKSSTAGVATTWTVQPRSCPCGEHMAVVTEARIVSPGIERDTIAKLTCLPEGWLQ